MQKVSRKLLKRGRVIILSIVGGNGARRDSYRSHFQTPTTSFFCTLLFPVSSPDARTGYDAYNDIKIPARRYD